MKKYELTDETIKIGGHTLHRIKALVDFGNVKAGDIGGWIEKEENLSQDGDAWVYENALVFGNAQVYDNSLIYDSALVYGSARVSGNARVYGDAWVSGNARVSGDARVYDNAHYLAIGPIGSRDDTVTFTREQNGGIYVAVGCFLGTLDEFRKKVEETHGDNAHAEAYLLAAKLAEVRIDTTPIDDEAKWGNFYTASCPGISL